MLPDEIAELLKRLAQALGTTVEYLWPVIVRQQYVVAAQYAGFVLLVGLPALYLVWYGWRTWLKWEPTIDPEDKVWIAVPLGLITLVANFVIAVFLGGAIGRVINPEFYALQWVLSQIK